MASNDNKSSKFTKFDRNRFRKVYPLNRKPASSSYRSTSEINMESISVTFTGTNWVEGALNNTYKAIPVIMAAPKVPDERTPAKTAILEDQANVNIFITEIKRDISGKITFKLEASAEYSGDVVVTVVSLT